LVDNAIVLPEALGSALDSLLADWFLVSHTYIDSTCVSGPHSPHVSDSLIMSRLAALPTVIEMPFNPVVRSYIEVYTQRKRALTEYMLGMGTFYFPIFEEILEREDMPHELKYLPIIESALKATARSRVGATGLWQIMVGTGKQLGLEVNTLVDERCDPYRSTECAVRYLKQLYNTYNDWNLAIAAYNCGPGNVNKAIRRAGGKTDYWSIYNFLPQETRGYVPAFIAANYVMNYYCEHNLCPVMTEIPAYTDTVMVSEMIHFKQISEKLGIELDQIRALNPQYRRDIVPGNTGQRPLRLPVQQLYTFIEHKDTIVAHRSHELLVNARREVSPSDALGLSATTTHRVKQGETLGTIAKKYHTTVASIRKLNNLKNDKISIGQRLTVSGKATTSASKTTASSAKTSASSTKASATASSTHTVRSGESLWSIAKQYPGVTAEQIKETNHLGDSPLKPGQKLTIPRT
jgi:membrane-bound lytic murein transglycosylase D